MASSLLECGLGRIFQTLSALVLALGITACQSPGNTATTSTNQPSNTMHAYETELFNWGLYVSNYNLDLGNVSVETLARDCWMRDAQGKLVMRFNGSSGGWGSGALPMGGSQKMATLPKTLHLAYYDYQEDRFYELEITLPQQKIYELFRQQYVSIDIDSGTVVPRYDMLDLGIGPQGFIMLWASTADGVYQQELGAYRAHPMEGMTVVKYNGTEPPFPLIDRWAQIGDRTALKPETVAKLKTGWLPDAKYYQDQRVKYPWRFAFSSNVRLVEFREAHGNQEARYVAPWEMALYKELPAMRGVPLSATFWLMDQAGNRHRLYVGFFNKERVTGEPDIAAVWSAFQTLFPGRTLQDNDWVPNDADMAQVEIQVSDDLKNVSARLLKGADSVALPVLKTQHFLLEPFAYAPKNKTPSPEKIKLFLNGPPQR